MGMAHLAKAKVFHGERNWVQSLRYAELALTKLKQLKDRSLAAIEILDETLLFKFNALNFMDRNKEALECATERYNMWATTFMRHPGTIEASFPLIHILIFNKEFDQAHLIASTVYEMALHPMTHDIPDHLQQPYLAQASNHLARATFRLAQAGGIPPEEKQKAGEEAIALARKALEIDTQLYGSESHEVANDMGALANVLDYFNDVDDDEAIRLYEQAMASRARLEGSLSVNVAVNNYNLGTVYFRRANIADAANDLNCDLANLELALPHFREAVRIFASTNLVDKAEKTAQTIAQIEEDIRQLRKKIAAKAAAATAATAATANSSDQGLNEG